MRRSIEAATASRRQIEILGGNASLDQAVRVHRRLEGPATDAFDGVDRVRRIADGSPSHLQGYVEIARLATDRPARDALRAAERAREVAKGPAQGLFDFLERARLVAQGPAQEVHRHYERLNKLLDGFDLQQVMQQVASTSVELERALWESLPLNWRALSLDDAERIEALVRLEGVPLVWVPGPTLTERIVGKETREEAMSLLLEEQDTVLRDIGDALSEVADPDLESLSEMATKAVAALRDGHPEAAQALAAAVFTSAIHDGLQHAEFRHIREEAEKNDPDQATFSDYRAALVTELAARYVQGRQWVRPGFNRSDTLHRVRESQYTAENSLAAVMAATVLLREAQARLDEERAAPPSAQ